jgi:hypothetical protein
MKTILLTLIAIIGISATAMARSSEKLVLKAGQQKTAVHSKLKIKFVEVMEDSRCPADAQCIWAGNAKIKIEVTSRRLGTKTFEINTTSGPQGDQFEGWAINLESLSPVPTQHGKPAAKSYTAKFTISRLTR